ncbi:hypothetical protein CIB84_008403, partial [Bambusicola thoracicus]
VTMTASPRERSQQQNFSEEFVPPEKPPLKQQWIPDDTETICMVCKTERFTMCLIANGVREETPNNEYSTVVRIPKATALEWFLSLNEEENEIVRSEFYYEQRKHMHLFNLFSLSYISKVDVLNILVAAAYRPVPSLDQILLPAAVTRLRNQLLEAEYYQLAIEVSTKSGLDPSGAWHAWGMACLKAGNLSSAREKFNRCLKPPVDLNQLNHGSRLVQDVLQYLESTVKPVLIAESPSEVFIEGIFIPSYESGKLHMLENLLETIDPGLESWGMYLIAACKYLQKKNYYHILYELQQFMKDHVRAAMTCIRFFTHGAKSYTELGCKQTWLIKIKDHLKVYLQEVSRSSGRKKIVYTFRKKMSATDVSRLDIKLKVGEGEWV